MTYRLQVTLRIITLLAFGGPLVSAQTAGQSPAPAATPLEGTWEGVEVGRETQGKCTMTVRENTLHFQGAIKEEWYKASFTLAPGKNPAELAATITECSQPDLVSKASAAIYKIENGRLTLSGFQPGTPGVPKAFHGERGARTFVLSKVPAPAPPR